MTTIQSREIKWNLSTGAEVTVTVQVNSCREGCHINAIYAVAGRIGVGMFNPSDCALSQAHPARKAGATNGVDILVWTSANQARIEAAVAELKKTPEWIASEAGYAAVIKSDEAYDAGHSRTVRAMSI